MMDRILEGRLDRFEVPDLLSFLGTGGRTGVLVFERPDRESKVFFREGRPVFAISSGEELRLGPMLLRLGKVRPEVLQRALSRKRGSRVGQFLLAEKVLTQQELAAVLKVQVSEIIFDSFGWTEGVFSFLDGVPPPATVVTLEMDLLNLIIEGIRRRDGRERAEAGAFPEPDRVVEALVNPDRIKQSAVLTEEEWRVFFLVDGRRTASEICRVMGTKDGRPTLAILGRLRAARFVGLAAPRAEAPAPPKSEPAGAGSQRVSGARRHERPPAVEFSSAIFAPLRLEDDTNQIVSSSAAPYLAKATRLTVSRLVLTAEGAETSFPLIRDSYTLGRHRNNDITIADPKVSSFHARIDRTSDGFLLVDLKSRNGCWVNRKKVETALLGTGDEIRVGAARLVYKVDHTSSV